MYLFFIAVYLLIADPNVTKVCYSVSGDLIFRIVELSAVPLCQIVLQLIFYFQTT